MTSRSLRELDAVILDVDDTVIRMDVAVRAGIGAVGAATGLDGDAADAVQQQFGRAYRLTQQWVMGWRAEDEPELAGLLECARRHQAPVLAAGHELKYWSRETMLAWAFESVGVDFDGALVMRVMRAYWDAVAAATELAPGAVATLEALRAAEVPFVLATNSDGMLSWTARGLEYDPEFSRRGKLRRLERALGQLGVEPDDVEVGDPIGKPSPRYAQRVMATVAARFGAPRWERVLAIGDSYPGDIEPFLAQGVGAGVWLRTRGSGVCDDPRVATAAHLEDWLGGGT